MSVLASGRNDATTLGPKATGQDETSSEFERIYRKFFGDYLPHSQSFEDEIQSLTNENERLQTQASDSVVALRVMTNAKEVSEDQLAKAQLKIKELEKALMEKESKGGNELPKEVHVKLAKAELKITQLETALAGRDVTLAAKEKELSSVHVLYQTTRDIADRLLQKGKQTTEEIRVMEQNRVVTEEVSLDDAVSTEAGSESVEANTPDPTCEIGADSSQKSESPKAKVASASPKIVSRLTAVSPMRIVAPLRDEDNRPLSRPVAWAERSVEVPPPALVVAQPGLLHGCASPPVPVSTDRPVRVVRCASPPVPVSTDRSVRVVRQVVSPLHMRQQSTSRIRHQSASPLRSVPMQGLATPGYPVCHTPQVAVCHTPAVPLGRAASPVLSVPTTLAAAPHTSPLRERMLKKTLWTETWDDLHAVPRSSSPLRVRPSMIAGRSLEAPLPQEMAPQVTTVERYLLPYRSL